MDNIRQIYISEETINNLGRRIKELEKIKNEMQRNFNRTYNEYARIKFSISANQQKSFTLAF